MDVVARYKPVVIEEVAAALTRELGRHVDASEVDCGLYADLS